MDLERLRELVEMMREAGVAELSIEMPDLKVSIKRAVGEEAVPARAAAAGQAEGAEEAEGLTVTSPVVGIFHLTGADEGRPVVEGDLVEEGEIIGAVEAMKISHELRSAVSGVIGRIFEEDGTPVEFGQPLFLIRPAENALQDPDGSPPVQDPEKRGPSGSLFEGQGPRGAAQGREWGEDEK
jgi:biotin carboxyl carrier protein